MTQVQVGVREMKARLSEYLRRVKKGESIEITEHGKAVARIEPASRTYPELEKVWGMVREGFVSWNGKKPVFPKKRYQIKGKPISETILEDRGDPIP